jgi:dTDP-4-dehydrorhamnose 3,5-epimerase
MIRGLKLTKLNIIDTLGGNVMHAMKKSSEGYSGFGEAYFSEIDKGAIKAWKKHKNMVLNLVVPLGKIKFVIFDNRFDENGKFYEIILSKENYCRLTVPPNLWLGFQGLSDSSSTLLNIADTEHNPLESEHLELEKINYDWSIK